MKEPVGTTVRWAVALCLSVIVAISGWAYSTVQAVYSRETARTIEKVEGMDFLLSSQTLRIQMLMTQMDSIEKMVRENNALLIKYLGRNE